MRVNDCALAGFYPRYPPRDVLLSDVESNPENYHRDGTMKALHSLKPMKFRVHVGMRVYFTRNVRKDIDYVNGMDGRIESYDKKKQVIQVRTNSGHLVLCTPWTDRNLGNMVYYPIKAGYASTILKFQGAELKKVAVYLDAANVPGGAYTALSRVSFMTDWYIGGIVTANHFTPAH